jgi:hypothetical protein
MRLVPKYAQIKIPTNNEAARKTLTQTQTQTQTMHIKNEINFLYKKKLKLHTQLYHIHLYKANIWQHSWNNIEQLINQSYNKK